MPEPATVPDPSASTAVLEGDLVKLARRGDLAAYDELVRRFLEPHFVWCISGFRVFFP